MLFTSINFLLLVSVTFALYYTLPKKFQWKILLIASYVFYFFAGAKYLPYIIVTTISAYFLTLKLYNVEQSQNEYISSHQEMDREEKKEYRAKCRKVKKNYMYLAVLINIGILATVKYTNFTIHNINSLSNLFKMDFQLSFVNLIVPLGISFYTFQTVSYILDVYYNKYKPEKNLFKLALFVSFFPQIIQGPISRFSDLSQTLFDQHKFDKKTITFGFQRILWGYFKKLVIADRALIAINTIIQNPDDYSGAYVFLGMMLYALQLYADFSGGIDITIGVAQIFQVKLKENFIRPYFSKSIKEYWTRWHITMGTWFTDYIFYPISLTKPMLKLSKFSRKRFGKEIGKRTPVYLATIIVWFTTGIWHGASWNFIVWGLANCAIILISDEFSPLYKRFHDKFDVKTKTWFKIFQVARTIFIMSCLRAFDCYRDVPLTFKMLGSMVTDINIHEVMAGGFLELGLNFSDYIVLFFGLILLVLVSLSQRKNSVRETISKKPYWVNFCIWYGLVLAILVFGIYGIGFEQSQFIYNQF